MPGARGAGLSAKQAGPGHPREGITARSRDAHAWSYGIGPRGFGDWGPAGRVLSPQSLHRPLCDNSLCRNLHTKTASLTF